MSGIDRGWIGKPISEDLLQRLYHALEQRYPGKVRRVIEVQPVAVRKTIDNEADARETIRRLEEATAAERGEHKP